MLLADPVLQTSLGTRKPDRTGKVRDIYDFGDRLLIVATDRISAFDYVLGSGIPDKGKVLTQLSAFWFERMGDLVPHHVIATDVAAYPAALQPHAAVLRGRSMLCRRTRPLPLSAKVNPGTTACRSRVSMMPSCLSMSPLNACMESGTVLMDSERFCAVTMTSSIWVAC